MPGEHKTPHPGPTSSLNLEQQIVIHQLEGELSSRERLTKAAEAEIGRVWGAYAKILKVLIPFAATASGVVLLVIGTIIFFFLPRSLNEIKEQAKKVAETEVRTRLNEEFGKDAINKLITEKANERIDVTAGPLVNDLVHTNIFPLLSLVSNRVETLNFEISAFEDRVKTLQSLDASRRPVESATALLHIRLTYETMMVVIGDNTTLRSDLSFSSSHDTNRLYLTTSGQAGEKVIRQGGDWFYMEFRAFPEIPLPEQSPGYLTNVLDRVLLNIPSVGIPRPAVFQILTGYVTLTLNSAIHKNYYFGPSTNGSLNNVWPQ